MSSHGDIFVIRKTGEDGSCFPLLSRTCRIGKGPVCDIRIQRENVLEEHCLIEVGKDSQVRIRNFTEKCQTSVSGVPLSTEWVGLNHMDVISIADRSFRWEYHIGNIFYRDMALNQQSVKSIANPECQKLGEENLSTITQETQGPEQNAECHSSKYDGPNLISFDSPCVVSDSKKQDCRSLRKRGICDSKELQSVAKEKTITKTPKRKGSLIPKETGVELLSFTCDPPHAVHDRKISDIQEDAQKSNKMLQKSDVCLSDEESASKGNTKTINLSILEASESKLIPNTPKTRKKTPQINKNSNQNLLLEITREPLNKNNKGTPNMTPKVLNFSTGRSGSGMLSAGIQSRLNKSICSIESTSSESQGKDIKIVVVPPTPELGFEDSEKECKEESSVASSSKNYIVFPTRRKSSLKVDTLYVSGRKSEIAKPLSTSLKLLEESNEVGGMDELESNSELSGSPCVNEEDKKIGEWVVAKEGESSRKGSLRNRKSFDSSNTKEQSSVFQVFEGDRLSDVTKTPLPSDEEYASWLSEISKRNSMASNNGTNPATPILERSKKETIHDSCTPSYIENVRNVMKTPLTVSVNITPLVQSKNNKSKCRTTCRKEKAFSPSVRRSNRKGAKSIGTPCFAASIFNRLKTPSTVDSKSCHVASVENNPNAYVTLRKNVCKMSNTQEMCSEDDDFLSDVTTNDSCVEDGEMDSLMQTSSLLLDESAASNAEMIQSEGCQIKSSWTSTPAASTSARKYRAKFCHSFCSGNMRELPQSPGIGDKDGDKESAKSKTSKTPTEKISFQNPTSFEVSYNCGSSILDSSYNSALDNTITLVDTPSILDKDVSVINTRTLRSSKSVIEDTPIKNQRAIKYLKSSTHRTPDTSTMSVKVAEKESFQNSASKSSVVNFSAHSLLGNYSNIATNAGIQRIQQDDIKSNAGAGNERKTTKAVCIGDTSPIDSACNLHNFTRSVSIVNGREVSETTEGESSRKGSVRSRKSFDNSNTKEQSSVFQVFEGDRLSDVTKTPLPSDEEYASWLSEISKRNSMASNNGTNPATPILERSKKETIHDSCTPSYIENVRNVMKTPLTVSVNITPLVQSKNNKSKCRTTCRKEKAFSPSVRRSNRKGAKSIGTPCFAASIFNRLKTPSTVDSKSCHVASVENNPNAYVTLRKNVCKMSNTQEMCSEDDDFLSDVTTNDSCVEDGEMDSLMQTSSLLLDESAASNAEMIQSEGCQIKSSWTSTPAASTSARKYRAKFCHSFCSGDMRELPQSPLESEVAHSMGFTTPDANSFIKQNLTRVSTYKETVRENTRQTPLEKSLKSPLIIDLGCKQVVCANESSAYSSAFDNTNDFDFTISTNANSSTNGDEINKMTEMVSFENHAEGLYKDYAKCDTVGEKSKTSLVNTLQKFARDVEEVMGVESQEEVKAMYNQTESGKKKSRGRKSSINSSFKVTPQLKKITKNSGNCATPDYSASNNYLMATPSVLKMPDDDETVPEGDASLVNASEYLNNDSVVETGVESQEETEGMHDQTELGKKKSRGRKSFINSSFKVTPQLKKITRNSGNCPTPDYSASINYLMATPSVVKMTDNDETVPEGVASLVNASEYLNNDSVVETGVESQEEAEKMHDQTESGKKKSRGRKSSINSSFKVTPQLKKITRNSGNFPTPDYSAGINYLMATPAVMKMTNNDETVPEGDASLVNASEYLNNDSVVETGVESQEEAEEMHDQTESGKKNSRGRKSSINSSFKVTPQLKKITRNSGNCPTPDYSASINYLMATPSVVKMTDNDETVPEGVASLVNASEYLNNDSVVETGVESQEEAEEMHDQTESGKKKSRGRKSSINSSFKVTPQLKKITRNSGNFPTPDYSAGINYLMATPSVVKMTNNDETVPEGDASLVNASEYLNNDSVVETGVESQEEAEEMHDQTESGKKKSRGRKSSINSSFKVTPQLKKITRNSGNCPTPDYSASINYLMATPSVVKMTDNDETVPEGDASLVNASEYLNNDSVVETGVESQEEAEEMHDQTESGKKNSRGRKSSINSSFKVTPQLKKITRNSGNFPTPDYSAAINYLMATPAVVKMTNNDETVPEGDASLVNASEYLNNDSVVETGVESQEEAEEMHDQTESGKKKSRGRKSSINSSFKVTPQLKKITRNSGNCPTPDYSASINYLMATPSVVKMTNNDETVPEGDASLVNASEYLNNDSVVETGVESQEEAEEMYDQTESGKKKSRGRKSSINSSFKVTPQLKKITRNSGNCPTPDYSASINYLMATPSVVKMTDNDETVPEGVASLVNASEYLNNDSVVETGVESQEEAEEVHDQTESGKKKSRGRKSSIKSSFKVTPQLKKITRNSGNCPTPDYSASINYLMATPSVVKMTNNDETVPEGDASLVNASEYLNNDSVVETGVESQEEAEEMHDQTVSGKKNSSGRKSSIKSSFKVTPQLKKITRNSGKSPSPDYSASINYLMATPSVVKMTDNDETVPEGVASLVNASEYLNNDSVVETGVESQEEAEKMHDQTKSGKKKSRGRKSSIDSSFKVTPRLKNITRNSVNCPTLVDSARIKDFMVTPAVVSRMSEDLVEDGETSLNNNSGTLKNVVELQTWVDSPEEAEEKDNQKESAYNESRSQKSSIKSSFNVTPHLKNISKDMMNCPTPDYSASIQDLMATPAVLTRMPVEKTIYEVRVDDHVKCQTGRCDSLMTVVIAMPTLGKQDIKPEVVEASNEVNANSNVLSIPGNTMYSPLESERRQFKGRKSSVHQEDVKCIKQCLTESSPTSRKSEFHCLNSWFTTANPQNSHDDDNDIRERLASPHLPSSKGEVCATSKNAFNKVDVPFTKISLPASCLQQNIISDKNPIVVVSRLSPDIISSFGGETNSIPVMSHRPCRNKGQRIGKDDNIENIQSLKEHGTNQVNETIFDLGKRVPTSPKKLRQSKSSSKLQSNMLNQRVTRRTKEVDVNTRNSELSLSEISPSHAGKENKSKRQQPSKKMGAKCVVVKDLLVNDGFNNFPDTTTDSLILKSNLRNITGQDKSKKIVHFVDPLEGIEEKKLEQINDVTSLPKKALTRKSVTENFSGKVLRSKKIPSSGGKSSEIQLDGGDVANDTTSAKRGPLRKRAVTKESETADTDVETKAEDDVTSTIKRAVISKAAENMNQSTVGKRATRSKKLDIMDKAMCSTGVDADSAMPGRQTRRTRGAERPNGTSSVIENKNLKTCNTKAHSQVINEKENASDPIPENHLLKNTSMVIQVQEGNKNEGTVTQRRTCRGKTVAKLESAIGMGENKNVGSNKTKSKSKSVKENENSEDLESEKQMAKKEEVPEKKGGKNNEVIEINKTERCTRRGKMVVLLDDIIHESARNLESNSERKASKRNKRSAKEHKESEENTAVKRARITKIRKIENVDKEPDMSFSEGVQSVTLPPKKRKTGLAEEENNAKMERPSRQKKNESRNGENVGKEPQLSSSEEIQSVTLPSKKQKTSRAKEENNAATERSSRRKKNESRNDVNVGKEPHFSSSEEAQSVPILPNKQKTSLVKEENNATMQRSLRRKKNESRNDDGKGSTPEIALPCVNDAKNIRKTSKATSVQVQGTRQEAEEKPKGRQLRNQKNIPSDASEIDETHRPSRKRTVKAEAPPAQEEKSRVAQKRKENVQEKKTSGRVLRKR